MVPLLWVHSEVEYYGYKRYCQRSETPYTTEAGVKGKNMEVRRKLLMVREKILSPTLVTHFFQLIF